MKLESKNSGSTGLRTFLEVFFLLWLLAVNALYYVQFKALFASHLERILHTWP
jgi:hypothetical protein